MNDPAAPKNVTPRARVLVADDDQATVWLWARVLQWGFDAEVVAVFDGNTAIARVAGEPFDLVITDLQMPGASGLDVLRETKRRDPRTPVVLSTAQAPNHVVAEARRLGAGKVIEKPLRIDDAVALARELLNRRPPSRARATAHGPHRR